MNLPLLKTNIDIKLSAHDTFHKKDLHQEPIISKDWRAN